MKMMVLTYAHLGFESVKPHAQNLSTGQRLLNTGLQSTLKKFLAFSFKQHSLSAFSGDLEMKKNKTDSTETIKKKRPKKV